MQNEKHKMSFKRVRQLRRGGIALAAVLWAVMLLTALVTVLAKTSRLETRISLASAERVGGKWACRAGIETAIGLLNDDTTPADSLTDIWNDPTECEDVICGDFTFTIRVVDESGKLNINTASKQQLLELPYMEANEGIVSAILDWRDKDHDLQASGAEAGYYRNLSEIPYEIRNGNFQTIRELLLVKDVTSEYFYGEDTNFNGELDFNEKDGRQRWPLDNEDDMLDEGWISFLSCYSYVKNVDAEGEGRVNINKADENELAEKLSITKGQAKWIVQNRKGDYKSITDLINDKSPSEPREVKESELEQPQEMDLTTFADIADRITVNDDKIQVGLVNVNTAPREVLVALTEGDEALADNIISYRDSRDVESVGELALGETMTVSDCKKIADKITTRSSVYTIYCTATSVQTGAKFTVEAVVDRDKEPGQILYWHQGAFH
jgi:type II secretory pathway component PulK